MRAWSDEILLVNIFHITLQVTDVLVVAIKECETFQQPTKCGGRKQHKGV